jgi:hypothetical protein
MWFAKWFGGRAVEEDEPARFEPTAALRIDAGKAVRPAGRGVQVSGRYAGGSNGKNASSKKGFDPYNSGAFDRNSAWERAYRR